MILRDIVLISLFAAITAILALFPPIPTPLTPVPITAQTLGVMLAGSVLGARRGFLAIGLLLALVALGLPALAGGKGGIGVFTGPTGGFVLAWPFGAWLVGRLTEMRQRKPTFFHVALANVIGGIGIVYLGGIPWLAAVAKIPFEKAAVGSLIFIPGDLVKAAIAAAIAVSLRKIYPTIARR